MSTAPNYDNSWVIHGSGIPLRVLASTSRRLAPDYINRPTRRTNAHTVGPSRQWFHGPNVLHPPAESPRPALTRVTPEHYITSLGQHGIALDTHVVRASLLRLSHNKRVLTRPCVALTALTAAGMTYGPTTILMSAPLPANAAEVRHSLGLSQQWHFGLRALLPP